MRCFVITKTHIIILICSLVGIISAIIGIKAHKSNQAVTAFNNSGDEIFFHVLPTSKTSYFDRLKSAALSAVNKSPTNIITDYGEIFEHTDIVPDLPETSTEVKPSQAPAATLPPAMEKTNYSSELIKNETDYEVSADLFKDEQLSFSKSPHILIMHTHTTECYTPTEETPISDNGRSTDDNKNMIAIGNIFAEEFEKLGIKVTHDTTYHDYPSYQSAYGRSLATAQKILKDNSDIEIILDIHRDAITQTDGTRVKLTKEINNIRHAQIMLVCGTDRSGLNHPDWRNNLNFAIKIQEKMNELYPGLMRNINLRQERFNQHLTKGSLIIEVGTHGNYLDEAKNSAHLIASVIGNIINQNG